MRVKPVPGPDATLIFLPARRTVRQLGSLEYLAYDATGNDHGLFQTEMSSFGLADRATTRHVPLVSDITAITRAP